MKIKGIENKSLVKEIGSFCRRLDGSDWHINVKLQPSQKKQALGISQLPILARRRILNATKEFRPAGYKKYLTVSDATSWLHQKIRECPIPSVADQEDKDQWCFRFQCKGTTFYLPQIELARVLFFHHSYITRLALVPDGLSEEFDVLSTDHQDWAQVNILPTSTLPQYVRGDHGLRRILAWLLFDEDARRAFNSIATYQLFEGENIGRFRVWRFRFDPPALTQVKLTVRGHFDQQRDVFLVYEIYAVKNLPCACPACVDFIDPTLTLKEGGIGSGVEMSPLPEFDPLIDDEEAPSMKSKGTVLNSQSVKFSFSSPVLTTRKGVNTNHPSGSVKESELGEDLDDSSTEVSTDEATIRGKLPASGFDALEDQSDDLHLYTHKFKAFADMVELLKAKGCTLIKVTINKLPAVKGYTKHLMEGGNPRCLSFNLLSKDGQNYALLEVDNSDNKNRLSTLLLKQPDSSFDWQKKLNELERRLLQKSLSWPTAYLNQEFASGYKRISHPKSTSDNKAFLDPHSVRHWAYRVYAQMN